MARMPNAMSEFHSGFVCLVGRPNTGKSTLTNALVGTKVAITSMRPQTTRHTIRGIVHREDFQIVLVDTPGLHRPRTLLGKRLNDLVRDTYGEVDVIGLCIPADEAIGPGDRWIVDQIRSTAPKTTLVAVVTKIDKVPKDRVAAQLVAVSELVGDAEIVPVSAATGAQVDVLIEVLAAALPPGPAYYPDGELTDEPEEVLMAELIREAALEGVHDELPHSLAVVIDEVNPREDRDDLVDVHALLYVERDSQKGIVIGKGGARLREVGTAARGQIEKLLGTKGYLDLRVKVAKNWQSDPKQLGRLGVSRTQLRGRVGALVPPRLGLLARPPADGLQFGGQRDQHALAVGRTHQLHADRQTFEGESRRNVDGRPAQHVPRPGHRARVDHGPVGAQAAQAVEGAGQWRWLGGRRRQHDIDDVEDRADPMLGLGFVSAGAAQNRLPQYGARAQVGHRAGIQDDALAQPLFPVPQSRRGPGKKVPRQPQAVIRVAGNHGVAQQFELFAHRARRGQDLRVQLGAKAGVREPG